jgi:hypothetical protein
MKFKITRYFRIVDGFFSRNSGSYIITPERQLNLVSMNIHTLFEKSIKGTTIYVLDGWHSLNTVPIIMPDGRNGLSISYIDNLLF